ncbi:hypothetical protein HZS_7723, partial [Henneguya salminicola]
MFLVFLLSLQTLFTQSDKLLFLLYGISDVDSKTLKVTTKTVDNIPIKPISMTFDELSPEIASRLIQKSDHHENYLLGSEVKVEILSKGVSEWQNSFTLATLTEGLNSVFNYEHKNPKFSVLALRCSSIETVQPSDQLSEEEKSCFQLAILKPNNHRPIGLFRIQESSRSYSHSTSNIYFEQLEWRFSIKLSHTTAGYSVRADPFLLPIYFESDFRLKFETKLESIAYNDGEGQEHRFELGPAFERTNLMYKKFDMPIPDNGDGEKFILMIVLYSNQGGGNKIKIKSYVMRLYLNGYEDFLTAKTRESAAVFRDYVIDYPIVDQDKANRFYTCLENLCLIARLYNTDHDFETDPRRLRENCVVTVISTTHSIPEVWVCILTSNNTGSTCKYEKMDKTGLNHTFELNYTKV